MKAEEGGEVGLVPVEEAADVESHDAVQCQEDDDEHVGDGRREIARHLPPEDRDDVTHGRAAS